MAHRFRGLCLLLLLLPWGIAALANPISQSEAQKIAQTFYQSLPHKTRGTVQMRLLTTSAGKPSRGTAADPDYYIFEPTGQVGFVIVAGEDKGVPVLGYSYQDQIEPNNLPPNLASWLEACKEYVSYQRSGTFTPRSLQRHRAEVPPIAPLLGGLRWDQLAPYNKYTPSSGGVHLPTGCLATAIAQIMRYHCWPNTGRGKVNYRILTLGQTILETLGKHHYAWADMLPTYVSPTPEPNQEAVARLMYEVGIACEMQYSPNGSGAYTHQAAKALVSHFKYSPTVQFSYRRFMNQDEWESLILRELTSRRPVCYAGLSIAGGHAFVCDGYDGKGLFHFNWGWGGAGNGYFSLLDLDPATQGTGAGGGSGYIIAQELITGIQPDTVGNVIPPLNFVCDAIHSDYGVYAKRQGVTCELRTLISLMRDEVIITPGVGVFDSNGELKSAHPYTEDIKYQMLRFYDKAVFKVSTSSLPDGLYQLRPIVRRRGSNEWHPVPLSLGSSKYISLRVDGNRIVVSPDESHRIRLSAKLEKQTLHANSYNTLRITVRNDGDEDYIGMYGLRFARGTWDTVINRANQFFVLSAMHVPAKGKITLTKIVKGPTDSQSTHLHMAFGEQDQGPGNDRRNVPSSTLALLPIEQIAPLEYDEGADLQCEVLEHPEQLQGDQEMQFTARLTNPHAVKGCRNDAMAFVFSTGVNPKQLMHSTPIEFLLAPSASETLRFTFAIPLPAGNYSISIGRYSTSEGRYKLLKGNSSFQFRLTSSSTAPKLKAYDYPTLVDDNTQQQLQVYPNPCRQQAHVLWPTDAPPIERVEVYNMLGQMVIQLRGGAQNPLELPVSLLPPGTYLLRAYGQTWEKSTRFVVR